MTYGDIFLQVLLEVSPEPKETVIEKFEFMKRLSPQSKLNQEIPESEAEVLLEQFRREKNGILAWLIRGGLEKTPFDA